MDIFIFKTDVSNKKKAAEVGLLLNAIEAVRNWNFDLEDCDNVLRIECTGLVPGRIESLLKAEGYICEMLK